MKHWIKYMLNAPEGDAAGGGGGAAADAGTTADQGATDTGTDQGNDTGSTQKTPTESGGKAADQGASDTGTDQGTDTEAEKGKKADKGGDETPVWATDWRERLAGSDEKKLAQLRRYNSPSDVIGALFNAQEKISKGLAKTPPGKDAKPEEIAEFRKTNGIPETAVGYLDKLPAGTLPEGVVLGDEDKAAFAPFLEQMHAQNADPATVAMGIKAFYEHEQGVALQMQQNDNRDHAEAVKALKSDAGFGAEYEANRNHLDGYLKATFPADVYESLINARMGNGKALFNDVQFVKIMTNIAREMNPTGSVMSGTGFDKPGQIDDEIAKIEKMMSTDWKGYHKDTATQERYRTLISARERIRSAGKA